MREKKKIQGDFTGEVRGGAFAFFVGLNQAFQVKRGGVVVSETSPHAPEGLSAV